MPEAKTLREGRLHVLAGPSRRVLRVAGWTALVSLTLCLAAHAQETERDAPDLIVPGQIAEQSEALKTWLAEIRARKPSQALERIAAQLEELEASADLLAERAEQLQTVPSPPAEIEQRALRGAALDRRFERLHSEAADEADALDQTLADLRGRIDLWKRARAEELRLGAPAAALRLLDENLAELRSAEAPIRASLNEAHQLLDRVTGARDQQRLTLEKIDEARERFARGLWERQAEPFWRSVPSWEELRALPDEVGDEFDELRTQLLSHVREHRDAIFVQAAIFVLLTWVFARTRAARGRGRTGAASVGLQHPWAAALVLALLLTPMLHGRARSFQLVVMPLGLLAWYLVVAGIVAPAPRRPLIWVAALGGMEMLRFAFPGVHVLGRLLLGFELAFALAGILWLRRSERLPLIPPQAAGWLKILALWLRLLIPALTIGLLATLLGYTVLADRIALLAVWGSLLAAGWTAIVGMVEVSFEHLLDTETLGALRMVRTSRVDVLRALRRGLRGLGLLGWAYSTLTLAGGWSAARSGFESLLSFPIGLGTVSISLGGVLGFFLTLWLAWLIARLMSFVLDQEFFSRVQTAPGVSFALSAFVRYAILVIGFLVAMGAIGFSLDRVALLLSAIGVGIGFGLQTAVNNFVSGAILLFERPIRVGDWVQVDDLFGVVSNIGIRASRVRTFDGADVIVPNGDLVSARVVNWTLSDRKRRAILPIGVAYGTPPRRVIELLEEVARAHPLVLDEPAPLVLFRSFGDSSLDFEIRAFTEADWLVVISELAVAASEALEDAGITIPFPQRDLHLRNLPELREALKEVAASRSRAGDAVRQEPA